MTWSLEAVDQQRTQVRIRGEVPDGEPGMPQKTVERYRSAIQENLDCLAELVMAGEG